MAEGQTGTEAPPETETEADGRAGVGPGAVTEPRTAAERGAGTVLVLGVVAAVLVLAVALGALAQAQAARGTAQTGADLAALAAATAARDGWEPCGRARETAAHNRVVVVACTEQGGGSSGGRRVESRRHVPRGDARPRDGRSTRRTGERAMSGGHRTGPAGER